MISSPYISCKRFLNEDYISNLDQSNTSIMRRHSRITSTTDTTLFVPGKMSLSCD